MTILLETNLPHLFSRGKVRDTYDLGDCLLMVATDRVSAFDVVLPTGIPHKGEVLTRLSAFWFGKVAHLVPHHLIGVVEDKGQLEAWGYPSPDYLRGRSMLVKKARRIEAECVVRGYLAGSGWQEYATAGSVTGIALPPGLRESDKLPEPIFTPTTKAEAGHDQPLTFQELSEHLGNTLALQLRDKSIAIYRFAQEYALSRGIIIADTKLEFGFIDGQLCLIDEVLTPDSSRFWAVDDYVPGRSQPSFDKQYLRDWLVASGWNKEPPAPKIAPEVVEVTSAKYREAYRRLTGQEIKG